MTDRDKRGPDFMKPGGNLSPSVISPFSPLLQKVDETRDYEDDPCGEEEYGPAAPPEHR